MTFGKHRPLVAVAGKREHAELKVVADVNRPIATLWPTWREQWEQVNEDGDLYNWTFTESLKRLKQVFKAIQAGHHVERQESVGFASLEAARNFQTRERLALLHAIKRRQPKSIYELAEMTERYLKNIQEDVRILGATRPGVHR